MMIREIERTVIRPTEGILQNSSAPPALKKIKLFEQYSSLDTTPVTSTAAAEFRHYLELCDSRHGIQLSCLEFWVHQSQVLPLRYTTVL